uniref:Carbohydrate kinase FGGY N-terminal domain-containing protein n=1 Tax=Anopheles atroparvus TaxID=41427 RepID=A0A182J1G4_ANOAO
MANRVFLVGVDVGTGSARAALVSGSGQVLETYVKSIRTWNSQPNYYEQSSEDIWSAVCECVKNVTAKIRKEDIKGIGFDATCSLVVLDEDMQPLTVSPCSKDNQRNIILWMDHRAEEEARFINATRHKMLTYVGGSVSLEMEIPKLLWLKRHMWVKGSTFFDLPDYLTFRATGSDVRSICSTVCKWNYDAESRSWCEDFLESIGLADELSCNNWKSIGTRVLNPGTPIEGGLSEVAAQLATKRGELSLHRLTNDLHIWPDFHGNRSPLADPNLKGMICGLTMTKDVQNLALLYLALIQALAMAAASMGGNATVVKPDLSEENRDYHERKYRVFQRMYLDQRGYERIMKG